MGELLGLNLCLSEFKRYRPQSNFRMVLVLLLRYSDDPEWIIYGWGLFGINLVVSKYLKEEYDGHNER